MTFINIYTPNIGTPKHIKQILKDLKGEIDSNTLLLGTCTPHLHKWLDQQKKLSICQAIKQVLINFKRLKFFIPQWYETRSQLQEENWKNYKCVEIKQYATE